MRFFAQTLFEHVRKQTERHISHEAQGSKLLFMVPSVPATAAVEIANRLVDHCTEHEHLGPPLIRVAGELCQEWESAEDPTIKASLQEISEKEWRDERGNLTSYRNASAGDGRLLLVLLVGVDRVTDASSLADFHQCDLEMLWEEELRCSFATWVEGALEAATVAFEEDTLAHFDSVLKPLVDRGLTDILQVSALLERLDLSASQDGRDAEDVLLSSLGELGLPLFVGYRFSGRRSFGPYIDNAVSFFSYDRFLEERARSQALRAIDQFREHNEPGELFDQSFREPFDTDQEFLDGLRGYIERNDGELRKKLRKCDFVTILDRILGFRGAVSPTESRQKRETVRKLAGGPVEVVLAGLWRALGDFKREAVDRGVFAHEALNTIRIESRLFRHDCDGESAGDRERNARHYLGRLLGGVDRLLEGSIDVGGLCGGGNAGPVESRLITQDVSCQRARTAEPSLEFSIELTAEGWEQPIVSRFAWRLPATEPYRVADELVQWAAQSTASMQDYCLPVFHVPYYEELMLAKDEEETRRVLQQCIQTEGDGALNLLDASDLDGQDPLLERLEKLGFQYDVFLQGAAEKGIHSALEDDWNSLRRAYEHACDGYLCDGECANSPLAALLFRSFLIVHRRDSAEGSRWIWEGFEPSGVVTVLHPALLEVLQAHVLYLLTCFTAVARRELTAPGPRAFRDATWQNYVDLAAIQMPLCGLVKNRDRVLDTEVRGEKLIHRLGTAGEADASLSTRLLLRYDAFEEEDISDADLFRHSRESTLIQRILSDYKALHPHANDGLSIAAFQNKDIQPLIAAVDGFLRDVCSDRESLSGDYAMSVTVFTESSDDTSVSRWISQWKERWQEAETQASLGHYRQSHLSVAHRIVSADEYYRQFQQLIAAGLEVDIAVLNDFIGAGTEGNDFEPVAPYDVTSRTLKFPILEKSFCALRDPGKQLQRARVLSNRQFRIATQHAEVMARLRSRETPQNTHHVVLGFGDYTPWQGVVDELHKRAEWVVCIDSNIDERLIGLKKQDTEQAREIIGFGSGVGSHGEANYTISTEQFQLSDVLHRLKASIGEVYAGWDSDACHVVAESVLNEARRLSGLSLVRATGMGESVRDFMANSLTRKLLAADGQVLCDQLVSLDAYRHWFDSADSDTRPDLVWMVAQLGDDGRLRLDLRLVECKLAQMSDAHLDKARQQLENGLDHLISVFRPRMGTGSLEDDRPDQRYWWLQLHRLIASKAEISGRDQAQVLTALERLAEGDYDIKWRAAALAFWTDKDTVDASRADGWPYVFEGQQMEIGVVSVGADCVQRLCTGHETPDLPWGDGAIRFTAPAQEPSDSAEEDDEGTPEEEDADRPERKLPGTEPPKPTDGSADEPAVEEIETAKTGRDEVRAADRVLIGVSTSGSRPVYWEFGNPGLNNRHLLLFGASGMGKTYAIQCLLCELGAASHNSLIVDYTSGFFNTQLEDEFRALLQPVQHVIRKQPLAINPFRQQVDIIGGEDVPEGPANTAQRISGVFAEVYRLGDQQKSALYQAVKNGVASCGELGMTLGHLIGLLEDMTAEGGTAGSAAGSVISKIRPFIDQEPFGAEDRESWERLFTDPQHRCHVLQLAGFLRDSSRLITEFSLIDLYWFYRNRGTKDLPRVVVLDEVQNLDHREESPLAQLLREGRKFGFSLILATQIMSNLERDERDRLFNAAHKLFFRPADTEIRTYADIAATATGEKADLWVPRLASLHQGECYSLGPSLNETTGKLETKAFNVQVTPITERVPHA